MSTKSVATLGELRTLAQQYADMVNSGFITTAEWNSYLNLAYFELYDLLVSKYGNEYNVKAPYSFTTDGTTYLYSLPNDFYKHLGLDLQLGTTVSANNQSWVTIRPFMFAERNRYSTPNFQSFYGFTNLRYRIFSNSGPTNAGTNTGTIFLTPTPAANQVLRLWYVPRVTELSSDNDTVDGISGWQDYIPTCAAICALRKEESDITALQLRKEELIKRIDAMAEGRDISFPQTVSDAQGADFWYPAQGGWSYGGGY